MHVGGATARLAVVKADNVLAVRQHAPFVERVDRVVRDQPGVVNALVAERPPQVGPRAVVADETDEADLGAKGGEVSGGVGGAPRCPLLRDLLQHRHRSLLAEAGRGTLKVGVEHRVADDERPQAAEAADDINGAQGLGRGHGDRHGASTRRSLAASSVSTTSHRRWTRMACSS